MPKILIYCQHLLGLGHVFRTMRIAAALTARGNVTLVLGGVVPKEVPLPGNVELIQLPAVDAGPDFDGLRPVGGGISLAETCDLRREILLEVFRTIQPDVLMTELYPFGRFQFDFELKPLLALARATMPRPLMISSVRDVLVSKQDGGRKERRSLCLLAEFYDGVIVHGDPRVVAFEQSFTAAAEIPCPLYYSGYVAPPMPLGAAAPDAPPRIVVSAGGGRDPSGVELLKSVLAAAHLLSARIPHVFHMFAGPAVSSGDYLPLRALSLDLPNVRLEKSTPDLTGTMKGAALSISMGGYNTVLDVLASGVRALVYTTSANGDSEQYFRAARLEALGRIHLLARADLTPDGLAGRIESALAEPSPRFAADLDGAERTAQIVASLVQARQENSIADIPKERAYISLASGYSNR